MKVLASALPRLKSTWASETAELPVIDFLEASKLLDLDVVSDQHLVSKLPFHSIIFRSFLTLVFTLTHKKATARAVKGFNARKEWRNKQPTEEGAPGQYEHDLYVMSNREMNYWLA